MPTFHTPGPISATVDIVLGNIQFKASDRADTVVEVRPADPSWELDVKAAEQANIEFADGKLLVKHSKLRTAFSNKYGSVEVLVQLPTGSDVQGDTAKGRYLVEGVVGSCQLKTPTGDIRVERAAEVRLRTTSGKVSVDHVTGQADVSANGEIRVRQVDGGAVVKNIGGNSWVGEVAGDLRVNSANGHITVGAARAALNARTASGDVRVGELGTGPVDLYTATGEVEVGVPAGITARLDAHTSAGRVRNQLEAPAPSDRTVKVRARSHGGDITVHRP
ncbi:DUF4097 family beta strand repeat-containing protein [Phytohabitans houttuyneae]|uniref:DUF4097 domain-containing protein n=1 Tax=Phytohabitans houttuyneae TaxID=1076126 RepID=A0A6V8KCS6_9ACTN|nr:DUF4097 family beta strand repeat-containing protein [Phytohabitans houttuyneae]GFJ81574.1 hypothetical protein Phou_057540 [Phytohabitans houttuyneae]